MRLDQDRTGPLVVRRSTSQERVMWMTPDRVLYVGLLGAPSVRSFGALSIYVGLDCPVSMSVGGGPWQTSQVAVAQPYSAHRVAYASRNIAIIQIEPESVDTAALPEMLRNGSGAVQADRFRAHALDCHQAILRSGQSAGLSTLDFDALVLGSQLAPRKVDPRIAQVLERIRKDPSSQALAQDCAEQVHLSFSRFLHLFRSEVGVSFRSFRTWKRARSLLHYVVDQNTTLTDVALGAGYHDSTHFSHSIRQVYGLKPKDIFAGSRKLRLIGPGLFA
jgi:AraC-like DNA-binding protein